MKIVGLQPLSLIDYPKKIACIIWTPKCDFRCPFCYNVDIVLKPDTQPTHLPEKDFFSFLKERKQFLDGVVITGGEPTLQPDLIEFTQKIKEMDFLVKLDTNGYHPEVLDALLNQELVDYVAMDIKAPLEKYEKVTRVETDTSKIKRSIELIKQRAPDYEFRTTVVPNLLDLSDIEEISQLIGEGNFILQQFEPKDSMIDPSFSDKTPYDPSVLQEMCTIAKKYVKKCKIRGIE